MLLGAGADVSAKARDGATALHDAAKKGHALVAMVLLAGGADVSAKNNRGYFYP